MPGKLDFKKEYKDLYLPKTKPALVTVPAMNFIMVDGAGAPEDDDYQQAIAVLYALTFTIKMSKMGGRQPAGYVDYVLPPLEGLWSCGDAAFTLAARDEWRWTSMIRQPDFVTPEVFAWALEEAAAKKPGLNLARARLETFEEGFCAQILHIGPFSEEQRSIDTLRAFIEGQGLVDDCGGLRRHHEIYLSDFRRTAPEKLKTVLRHPVAK